MDRLFTILLELPVLLIALPFHEFAHAYTAYKLGDTTAKNMGRLTLNPVKHLDILGLICLLIGGFGWAKPVPVNYRNFKNPKLGFALTALAGPVSNLFLALVSFILLIILKHSAGLLILTQSVSNIYYILFELLLIFCSSNVMLAAFNLIPLPPLDGSRIASLILPDNIYNWLLNNERYISLVFLALVIFGVFDAPLNALQNMIYTLIFKI